MVRIIRRLQRLVRRPSLDAASREEMQDHVDRFVTELMYDGVPEPEARRRARLELGSVEVEAERLADGRPGARLADAWHSITIATRSLLRARTFTATAVLLIALGIGASTTLFTVVNRVLLRPLALPDPAGLVRVYESSPLREVDRTGVSRGNLAAWRARAQRFTGLASFYTMGRTLSEDDRAEVAQVAQVTCDFFGILAVTPIVGTTFSPDECRRATFSSAAAPTGADPVLVLGEELWRRRFNADRDVIGRVIQLDRRPFRIIGVIPNDVGVVAPRTEAFIAWELQSSLPYDQRYTTAIGRLRRGVTAEGGEAELRTIATALAEEHPEANRDWSVRVVPLQQDTIEGLRPVLFTLLAAAGVLLLIACANVGVLFSARALARSHELAVHMALGASRGRMVRQGLLEAGLVAVLGGSAGAAIAFGVTAWLRRAWSDLPRASELAPDAGAALFAAAMTLLAAILAGLAPALRQGRGDTNDALRGGGRAGVGSSANRTRTLLVIAEVAMTVVLLSGAGLLVRSVSALQASDPGFDTRDVVVAPIFLDSEKYSSGAASRTYYAELFARLRRLPGVVAVGAATTLPATGLGPGFARPVWPLGRADDDRATRQASVRMITPGYLETLRIPLVDGRAFDERDVPDGARVVAVSERLASTLWPGKSPVGEQLVVDYATAGTYPYEVVGVVGDVRFDGPRSDPAEEIYFPHAQRPYLVMNVAVRSAPGVIVPLEQVRDALRAVDLLKPAHGIYRLEELFGATYLREQRATRLISAFAAVASVLSLLGLYGVVAYRVRQRTREIGVRMALGATTGRVVGWVAAEVARVVAIGAVAGIVATLGVSRFISALLYGVAPNDPGTLGGVLLLLAVIGVVATTVPALRAARVNPASALRND